MAPEQMQKIIDGAPEDIDVYFHPEIGYISNMGVSGGCTNQIINCFINDEPAQLHPCFTTIESFIELEGVLCIDDLRTELAKREPMDLRDVDIPHGTIVLEK